MRRFLIRFLGWLAWYLGVWLAANFVAEMRRDKQRLERARHIGGYTSSVRRVS